MPATKNKKSKKSYKKVSKFNVFRRRSGKQKFIAFLSIVLVAVVGSALILQTFAATPDASMAVDQYNRMNTWRAQNGKPGLTMIKCISEVAQSWAQHMADTGTLAHQDLANYSNHCGGWGPNQSLGENVGRGPNTASLFDAFKASPPHNANMLGLEHNWTKVGIGAAWGGGQLWVVHGFYTGGGGQWDTKYEFPSNIRGSLDSADCNNIKGWALNAGNPSAPIRVDIKLASSPTDTQTIIYNGTNVYRSDANALYQTTGNHGFSQGVPLSWQGKTFIVQANGIDYGTNPSIGIKGVACGANYHIDSNARDVTSGWSFDRNYKSQALTITIRYCWDAGNTNCPTQKVVKPGIVRNDVNNIYGLTGSHGFKIAAPAPFKSQRHYTFVYAKNTSNGEQMYIGGGLTP